uniref:Ovule protein n=1 Tax=Strongyloides stercoralis TaxID=6248 RepID=A0A0K0DS43_STRER
MYANEVDINSHTDEYSECLHVCLIINNSFEEMSKKDSIFTWTVLPTHGVKQLGKLGNILDCRICFILLSSFLNCKTVDDLDLVDKYRKEPTRNPF